MSLGDRENELLDTLEAVIDADLPYVLVGEWAIAAFDQRFTTDVDIVIPAQAIEQYRDLLTGRDYRKIADVERNDTIRGTDNPVRERHRQSGSVRRDGRRARLSPDGSRVVVSVSGRALDHRAVTDCPPGYCENSGAGVAVCAETPQRSES